MNDSTNCMIILGIFGFLFYFLAMVNIKTHVLQKHNDKTCDPIQLFLKSLNQNVDESISSFKKCVNHVID